MDYIHYTYINFTEDASFQAFVKGKSEEDVAFWENWIKEHPEKKADFELAYAFVAGIDRHFKNTEVLSKEDELAKLLSSIENNERLLVTESPSAKFQFIRIAALILLLIGVGTTLKFLFFNSKNTAQPDLVYKELKTPRGKRMFITLTDGTHIWLNSESSLKYPEKFTGKERIVYLNGEAYFDVAHNKHVPFAVITSEIRVNVVGTTFNVKSYSDDNKIETTLETGVIRIEKLNNKSGNALNEIVLKPNQKYVFYKESMDADVENIENNLSKKPEETKQLAKIESKISKIEEIKETEIFTGWKNNKLVFKNERLYDLKKRLERWYNVKIGIAKPELNNKRLSGTFVNESVDEALKALRFASDINYFHRNDSIIIFTDD